MKLAAMEGLYKSEIGTPIVVIGVLNPDKSIKKIADNPIKYESEDAFLFKISIPQGLSLLVNRKTNTFVPGIEDILGGGYIYLDKDGVQKSFLAED